MAALSVCDKNSRRIRSCVARCLAFAAKPYHITQQAVKCLDTIVTLFQLLRQTIFFL